ncbi:glycoside hydrolase family 32 protein [Chitinophaga agrisoli]|nr:glycoside hydrolase family 32 protein [Chitinophaga agrisoli]
MKRILLIGTIILLCMQVKAQFSVQYDPAKQPTDNFQYFTPSGEQLFVGDCIPFFHNDTYYLYWLLDSAHHSSLNGLGGHQWVLSTTKDLKHWKNFPIVLGIDEDWEKSICTGSVVYANNRFYAYYATRLIDNGKVNEQLSYAISEDGIHFVKQKPNPFYTSAPGYSKRDFRDPKVTVDKNGVFNLFVSSRQDQPVMNGAAGALVHLSSRDRQHWAVEPPVLTGQPSVPECPDYFNWNGWYYLVYSHNGNTFYVKSRNPLGPWEQPRSQALNEDWANVVKTAEFTNGRRIAAGWIPSRRDGKDDKGEIFGGSTVFRELIQEQDGTLSTKFPPEMLPDNITALPLQAVHDSLTTEPAAGSYLVNAPNGQGAVYFKDLPADYRVTMEITPTGINEEYGLVLRSGEHAAGGYALSFSAINRIVKLANTSIEAVDGLDKKITLDIIVKNSIIDVCVNGKRCIVNRLYEQKGSYLWLYAKHGKVKFSAIKVYPLSK